MFSCELDHQAGSEIASKDAPFARLTLSLAGGFRCPQVLSGLYILILALFPPAAPISHVLKSAYLHGSKPHHNPLCRPLTTLSRLCIYESWRACNPPPSTGTATGASSNPFAISVDGRASAWCAISVPHRSCSNAFPRLRDVPSTPRSGISVPPPHSGTQRSNWTSFALSTPMPANRSEEHTSELQSHSDLVCRLLLEKKKNN